MGSTSGHETEGKLGTDDVPSSKGISLTFGIAGIEDARTCAAEDANRTLGLQYGLILNSSNALVVIAAKSTVPFVPMRCKTYALNVLSKPRSPRTRGTFFPFVWVRASPAISSKSKARILGMVVHPISMSAELRLPSTGCFKTFVRISIQSSGVEGIDMMKET